MDQQSEPDGTGGKALSAPSISLPKGGGAIRGIGEKFAANPVTGTGSMTVPIATSPGRSGFGPQLALSYDSGAGNGPFGFGWTLVAAVRSPARPTRACRGIDDARGVRRLHPVRRGRPGAGPRPRRRPIDDTTVRRRSISIQPLPPAHRRAVRPHRALDANGRRRRPLALDLHATTSRPSTARTPNSRIADPADTARIFSWLICETHDDKGNAIVYEYKPEDGDGVDLIAGPRAQPQRNRRSRTANRYLKRIRYGNRAAARRAASSRDPDAQTDAGWMFEVVFDYGEHDADATRSPVDRAARGPCRHDPFSTYRAGFEVRTYRLCRRVLMFHHFPGRSRGRQRLPGALDRLHLFRRARPADARNPIYSFLRAVTQTGYRRHRRRLPEAQPAAGRVRIHPAASCRTRCRTSTPRAWRTCPSGWTARLPVDRSRRRRHPRHPHRAGRRLVLQAQPQPDQRRDAGANSRRLERVAAKPNLALAGGQAQFMDLAGDGQLDLVVLDGPMPGFYEHDGDEGWQPFRPFTSRLNRDTRDPNLRFVDLDGDGHADMLITEDDAFVWHPSLAEEGFGPARRVHAGARRGEGPAAGLRRRHAVHLPRRHERRRPDRPGAHPQRRGLLLAQPRLRPLRRQGDDGPRALVRPPRPVRPQAHPAGRHRRLRHHRHHLPAPRRRAPLLQPVRQQLERAAAADASSRASTTSPPSRRPICSATAPPAWSGPRRCRAMRGGRCATSI